MKKLILLLLIFPSLIFAQYTEAEKEGDVDVSKKLPELTDYKNTIRWNLTPMALFGARNVNLGYERVITDKSTVSINVGYLEIPKLLTKSEDIEYVSGDRNRGGFSVFVDYNFYIANRNARKAPEGVYFGVFSGLYNQTFSSKFKLIDPNLPSDKQLLAEADLATTINNLNLGLQIGYQFVFYDRFTVDLILVGPAVAMYRGKIGGDITVHADNIEENDVYKKFVGLIVDKAPWLADAVDGDKISASGSTSSFSVFGGNFRYVLQVGYRF